jgi:hypothetical protein
MELKCNIVYLSDFTISPLIVAEWNENTQILKKQNASNILKQLAGSALSQTQKDNQTGRAMKEKWARLYKATSTTT